MLFTPILITNNGIAPQLMQSHYFVVIYPISCNLLGKQCIFAWLCTFYIWLVQFGVLVMNSSHFGFDHIILPHLSFFQWFPHPNILIFHIAHWFSLFFTFLYDCISNYTNFNGFV